MAPGRASAGQAVQAAQLGAVRMRDRVGPIVSLSGYLAADTAAHDPSKPSMTAAIAASAATVLRLYLPELSGDIDKEVERALDGERRAGASGQRIDAGARLGRFVAVRTISRTKADRGHAVDRNCA